MLYKDKEEDEEPIGEIDLNEIKDIEQNSKEMK